MAVFNHHWQIKGKLFFCMFTDMVINLPFLLLLAAVTDWNNPRWFHSDNAILMCWGRKKKKQPKKPLPIYIVSNRLNQCKYKLLQENYLFPLSFIFLQIISSCSECIIYFKLFNMSLQVLWAPLVNIIKSKYQIRSFETKEQDPPWIPQTVFTNRCETENNNSRVINSKLQKALYLGGEEFYK